MQRGNLEKAFSTASWTWRPIDDSVFWYGDVSTYSEGQGVSGTSAVTRCGPSRPELGVKVRQHHGADVLEHGRTRGEKRVIYGVILL